MRMKGSAVGFVLMAALLNFSETASADEKWAAIDPTEEGPGPVVWGSDREETRARAVAACKKISNTCSDIAASVPISYGEYVFAYMCCTRPDFVCSVGVDVTKEGAAAKGIKVGTDADYTGCAVRKYLSANTGKPL